MGKWPGKSLEIRVREGFDTAGSEKKVRRRQGGKLKMFLSIKLNKMSNIYISAEINHA